MDPLCIIYMITLDFIWYLWLFTRDFCIYFLFCVISLFYSKMHCSYMIFYYHRNVVGEIHIVHNIKMENMFVIETVKDTYQR